MEKNGSAQRRIQLILIGASNRRNKNLEDFIVNRHLFVFNQPVFVKRLTDFIQKIILVAKRNENVGKNRSGGFKSQEGFGRIVNYQEVLVGVKHEDAVNQASNH